MPAPKALSGLPKPVLFGLYGAVGGLLGALVFGELAWRLLKPPPPPPEVAVSASAAVTLYPASANTIAIRIPRGRFEGPASVTFGGLPPALTVPPVNVAPDTTEVQAAVVATAEAVPGEYKATYTATAEAPGGGTLTAAGEFKVLVVPPPPPPPAIAVAVAPNLAVYKKGTGKFTVSVARRGFDGPINLAIAPLPAGVTADPTTIPSGTNEIEVTLKADDAAPVGDAALTITGEGKGGGPKAPPAAAKLAVQNPPVAPVDVVFVLDVTASMQWAIDDLKNGIGQFADTLSKNQIDFRLGLVTFRDLSIPGEGVEVLDFKGGPLTGDAAVFREKAGAVRASGGGDIPESSLEAIAEASKIKFRQGTTRILLLITDAPPKVPGGDVPAAVAAAGAAAKAAGVDSVHLVIQRFELDAYKPLLAAGTSPVEGKYFNLRDVVLSEDGFDELLATFGKAVTAAALARNPDTKPVVAPPPDPPRVAASAVATPKASDAAPAVKSLQSAEGAAAGSEGRVVLRSGVWTAAIAGLVCLALLAGQHHYLRGSLPAAGGILVGLLGGAAVGFVGGAAGQGLYMLASNNPTLGTIFQVLGWALLGGLAGAGLSPFIPNLKWTLGLVGGAIGGAVGAAGFLAASDSAGEVVGRLVGGLLLGFCIGLMVAIVEAAFRRAWLEVRYGARETIAVTLGPEPVKIGGDSRACTVWARGAAPVALRFFVRDGQVVCDDTVMKRETAVGSGFSKEVGNVTVTVRTGSGGATAPAPLPPPPPPARVPSRAVDDDYDVLPMPASPPPARPAPPKPAAAPLSLDDDPLPPPPPPPKPAPAPPRPAAPASPPKPTPVVAKPPAPAPPRPAAVPSVPPKPPAPPTAAPKPPAVPTGPKNPDACPTCGRVNVGKPKQRYCMVCDNTY